VQSDGALPLRHVRKEPLGRSLLDPNDSAGSIPIPIFFLSPQTENIRAGSLVVSQELAVQPRSFFFFS